MNNIFIYMKHVYILQGKDCIEEKILVVICTIYCENLFFYNIIFHDHEKGRLSTFNFNFNFITFVFFNYIYNFLVMQVAKLI